MRAQGIVTAKITLLEYLNHTLVGQDDLHFPLYIEQIVARQ